MVDNNVDNNGAKVVRAINIVLPRIRTKTTTGGVGGVDEEGDPEGDRCRTPKNYKGCNVCISFTSYYHMRAGPYQE